MADEELKKFEKLAQDWWNVSGPMKMLHQLNSLRLEYINKNFSLEKKSLLDFGCGGGILTESLYNKNNNIIGMDNNEKLLEIANSHKGKKKIIYLHASKIDDFKDEFDGIFCFEVLEHVPNFKITLEKLLSKLKSGGTIFLSTINKSLISFIKSIVMAEYVLNIVPKGTHSYEKFIMPSEINEILENNNCLIKDIKGIEYSLINKNLSITRNCDVNYILHGIKI